VIVVRHFGAIPEEPLFLGRLSLDTLMNGLVSMQIGNDGDATYPHTFFVGRVFEDESAKAVREID
jgi:hypothetical protein